ncbi:AbfB domain-containing protein [Duganella sp. PWIR1]
MENTKAGRARFPATLLPVFLNIRMLVSLAAMMLLSLLSYSSVANAEEIVKIQSQNYPNLFWRSSGLTAVIGEDVNPENNSDWRIVPGLADASGDYVSFQSISNPGYYLRQSSYNLILSQSDNTLNFALDATFKKVPGLKDPALFSFQSYRFPQKYIRHYHNLRLDNISTDTQRQDATFKLMPDECGGIGMSAEDVAALQSCSGDPASCSVGGDDKQIYKVAMRFDRSYTDPIDVYAESRRRIFFDEAQSTAKNRCVTALVDVRDYLFEGEPLQARDPGIPGLNLRVAQGVSGLTALSAKPVLNPVTIFIAGDSTVADQPPQLNLAPNARYTGWGGMIPRFFANQAAVANYADSGEGTKAFRVDGGFIWYKIDYRLKANDWVLIQLGHNDKDTSAELYRSRILGMINAIKAKGAHPVLVTPMVRNNGVALASQHIYGDLNVRTELTNLSVSENVPLIDLMKISSEWVTSVGRTTAQTYFVGTDTTHSNELGAQVFAQMVEDEIARQNFDLAAFLRK